VQLREPEALGVLDEHHRRVGHVDADLDHRRGDQHVELAVAEGAHHRVLVVAGMRPCSSPRGGAPTRRR
jgi:hypothetical protein